MVDYYQILFICSGNVCRSPMAEALMRTYVPERLKNKVKIVSAGTLGIYGDLASAEAVQVMQEKKIDLRDHVSRGISKELIDASHIIFVMSRDHLEFMQHYFPLIVEKIFLLRRFAVPALGKKEDSIQDPMGFEVEYYRKTRDVIDFEIKRILPHLIARIDKFFKSQGTKAL
jgi:protein-tyrosine-phosphatase